MEERGAASLVKFSPQRWYSVACCRYRLNEMAPIDSWSVPGVAANPWKTSSEADRALVWVQWSHQRPGVFFALDKSGVLHIWDLTQSQAGPVLSESLDTTAAPAEEGEPAPDPRATVVTSIALSGASSTESNLVSGSAWLRAAGCWPPLPAADVHSCARLLARARA